MAYDVSDFEVEVTERSRQVPVLVDFWSPHCGPCLMFAPLLEKLAGEAEGKWDLVKVNTMDRPDLAERFGVNAIPDIRLFKDGKIVDQFLGYKPESEVARFLKPHLISPHQEELKKAEELLGQGQGAKAALALENLEPKDDRVWFLLAQAHLSEQPSRVAEVSGRIPYDSEFADRSNALEKLAAMLLMANLLPDGPARAQFKEGLEALQRYDFGAALEAFLDVMKTDRGYANGSAAEACRALFQFLGLRHPLAEKHHRTFSSLLYS